MGWEVYLEILWKKEVDCKEVWNIGDLMDAMLRN